ncbi:hypothetical protein EV702DRAFT_1046627 [Suillus placidus]|uniref:Uncharacterized protein n=1 Tax=Suillus placidus TaxID=48579 RepID=A0A9P6ZTR8_9AGAM|nr:hypothetical protein EV702DRAFT_1046627 [Suillus placidus]
MYNPTENFGVEEHFGLRNLHLDTSCHLHDQVIVFIALKYYASHREAINANAQRLQPCTAKTRRQRTNECDDKETEGMDEPQTLAECLAILKETKDVFVSLVKSPAKFAQGVLKKFLNTIPDDAAETRTIQKGDITVIQDTINSIEDLHCKVHRGLDTILEMCGVCNEWKAGNNICQSMRRASGPWAHVAISSMMTDGPGGILFPMETGGPMYANDIYILDVEDGPGEYDHLWRWVGPSG